MAKQSPSREARSGWEFLLHGRAHPSRFRDAQPARYANHIVPKMAKQSPSREARSGWGFLLHGRAHPSRFRDAQNGVGASCCGMLLQSAWGEGSEWRRFGARTSCQGLGFRRGLFLAYPVRVPRSCFTHGGPMKIVSYETRAVVVPREPGPPVGGANVAPFVALTLRTDDGIEGIGYAGFVSDVILKSLHECVNAMAELPLAATRWTSRPLASGCARWAAARRRGWSRGPRRRWTSRCGTSRGRRWGSPSTSCWAAIGTGCPPTRAGSCGAPTTWKRLPRRPRASWMRGIGR